MGRYRNAGLWGLGLFLALGLIIATGIAAGAVGRVKLAHQTITVKGYAERPIVSDTGVWSAQVTVEHAELAEAYGLLEADVARLTDYVTAAGFGDGAVVSAASISTVMKRDADGKPTNDIDRHRLTQAITVQTPDVAGLSRLSRESTSLIRDGVRLTSFAPEFYYSDLESLKIAMLADAMANAYERAGAMASSGGGSVGRLVEARQGVFQITPPLSNDVSDYGRNDTTTVAKVVKSVVTADFALQ